VTIYPNTDYPNTELDQCFFRGMSKEEIAIRFPLPLVEGQGEGINVGADLGVRPDHRDSAPTARQKLAQGNALGKGR